MPLLELKLLGPPIILLDGQPIKPKKDHAVLFYLAVSRGGASARSRVVNLLWSNGQKANLDQALSRLRKNALEPFLPEPYTDDFFLQAYWLDIHDFETTLTSREPQPPTAIETALKHYRGDFLDSFQPRQTPAAFYHWIDEQQAYLERLASNGYYSLAIYYVRHKQLDLALEKVNQLLKIDNYHIMAIKLKLILLALTGGETAVFTYRTKLQNTLPSDLYQQELADQIKTLQHQLATGNTQEVSIKFQATSPAMPIKTTGQKSLFLQEINRKIRHLSPSIQIEAKTDPHKPPFLLPASPTHFVGRQKELTTLCHALKTEPAESNLGENVYALVGMGGIGKTTLAIQVANHLKGHFTDGILWADLREGDPLDILEDWAHTYNLSIASVDLQNRAAILCAALAEKRALIILENVDVNFQQAQKLLPNGPTCKVIVTTRHTGVAYHITRHVTKLEELNQEDGLQLLTHFLTAARVQAELEAAQEICTLLQNLPLALTIVANRLARQPSRSLTRMTNSLKDTTRRLAQLQVSDLAVRVSFAMSWDVLTHEKQAIFALLAVFAGRSFTDEALAYVAHLNDPITADDILFDLADLSLLNIKDDKKSNRYQQHLLLADFAREQLGDAPDAYQRMSQYYLQFARQHQNDYDALRPEWDNLMAGMKTAYQQQLWPIVADYANVLTTPWFTRARFTQARQGYTWAIQAAHHLHDKPFAADCHLQRGRAALEQGHYAAAKEHLQQSLRIYQTLTNAQGTAESFYYQAIIEMEQSNYDKAESLYRTSRQLRLQQNDLIGVAATVEGLARTHMRRGNHTQAYELAQEALTLHQRMANKDEKVIEVLRLLVHISLTAHQDLEQAERYAQQALALAAKLQNQGEFAVALYSLSKVKSARHNFIEAQKDAQQSLALLERMGDQRSQAMVIGHLAMMAYQESEDYLRAIELGNRCIHLLQKLSEQREQAKILHNIAYWHYCLNQYKLASTYWQQALPLAQATKNEALVTKIEYYLPKADMEDGVST